MNSFVLDFFQRKAKNHHKYIFKTLHFVAQNLTELKFTKNLNCGFFKYFEHIDYAAVYGSIEWLKLNIV